MESYLIWLLIIILHCLSMQFDQVLSSSPSISNPNHFCPNEQRLILLQFKHMFPIENSVASLCGKYEQSNPKTLSWNENSTNCCSWDGVKCDNLTGHVTIIDLSCSQLFGTFHPNITLFKLPSLKILNLAFNNFQKSSIPSSIGMLAPTLTHLILSGSSLAGLIPSEITLLSKLVVLDLSKNEGLLFHNYQPNSFNFDYIIRNLTQLQILNLDYLNMSCTIPNSLMNLTSLKSLHLRENGLYGEVPKAVFNLPSLKNLMIVKNHGLNGNFHKVNLNINETSPLKQLELSYISLSGGLPYSIGHLRSLKTLKIEYCNLNGSLPDSIGNLSQLIGLSLRSNNFTSPIPSSVCNMNSLMLLDFSKNGFNGTIPPCLGNFSATLAVLDLRKNHFHGDIPSIHAKHNMLRILALNANQLQGPIPESLSLCNKLQVLDIGNNMINGTFPSWLDALPELEVLVLRSNRLHGLVDKNSTTQSPFSKLAIFDISHNKFTGYLPSYYLKNFNAMKMVTLENTTNKRLKTMYKSFRNSDTSIEYKYLYSITITMDGSGHTHLEAAFLNRTRIDLSRNKFEGTIPPVFGELTQLKELNMSNNHLIGDIPTSLSNLTQLLSLDLSSNQLTGEIPQLLTRLSLLQTLNLSCNRLEGRIPRSNSFDIFSNSSYLENTALCGPPLSKKCQGYERPTPQHDSEDDTYAWIGFTWQVVLMGYAFGMLIGLTMGCVSIYMGKPKWVVTMIHEKGLKLLKKYK